MKAYVPDRTPLPSMTSVTSSASRKLGSGGSMLPIAIKIVVVGAIFAMAVVWFHTQHRAIALARAEAAAIQQNLNRSLRETARWRQHSSQRDDQIKALQSRYESDLDRVQQQLETTQLSLSGTLIQLKRVQESERALLRDVQEHADELHAAAKQTVLHLSSLGQQLVSDPVLAFRQWEYASAVADKYTVDDNGLLKLLAQPMAKANLPDSCTVVAQVEDSGPAHLNAAIRIHNPGGQFVHGLTRADIDAFSGDRRLHAVSIRESSRPIRQLNIALALDASGSTAGMPHESLKAAVARFVESLAMPARIRVWRFADEVTPLTPWTIDSEVLASATATIATGGGTALNKAIRLVVEDVSRRSGQRAVVVFTDGKDSFQSELLEPTLSLCRQQQIPVHVVALRTRDTDESVLRRITSDSQGSYFAADDPTAIITHFEQLSQSLRYPVYELEVREPYERDSVTLRVGQLPPLPMHAPSSADLPQ